MRRILIAVMTAVMFIGLASTASASPRQTLRVSAFSVSAYGPSSTPVDLNCLQIHTNSSCGGATATVTIKGFDAYGGIGTCLPYDSTCTSISLGHIGGYGTGSARLFQIYRCGTRGAIHFSVVTLESLVVWQGYPSEVTGGTRIDSNTAKVQTAFVFPNPHSYSTCPETTQVLAARLDRFVIGFTGENGVPDQVFKRDGIWAVPLSA